MEQLIFIAVLLVVGYAFGSIGQIRHYDSIRKREEKYRDILLFNEKKPPEDFRGRPYMLVSGSVVMGCDYFRMILANLKMLVGGQVSSFETMLDRGRREAILRMKAEARSMGAKAIFNVRMETSTLSFARGSKNGGLACMELLVYGTAWRAPLKRPREIL